jgi:hypothetical protein
MLRTEFTAKFVNSGDVAESRQRERNNQSQQRHLINKSQFATWSVHPDPGLPHSSFFSSSLTSANTFPESFHAATGTQETASAASPDRTRPCPPSTGRGPVDSPCVHFRSVSSLLAYLSSASRGCRRRQKSRARRQRSPSGIMGKCANRKNSPRVFRM